MVSQMTSNNPPVLIWKCNLPPREIIPDLIEWWLSFRKYDKHYSHAEITQIESARVEDSSVVFSPFISPFMDNDEKSQDRLTSTWTVTVFVDNKKATQSMIISASSKTGMLRYVVEDAKGNLSIDPLTGEPREETIHNDNILIYCCLPIPSIWSSEKRNDADWNSETPLKTLL
jgi:hypothetical protein